MAYFRTFRGGDSVLRSINANSEMRKMSVMKSKNRYANDIVAQRTSHQYHHHRPKRPHAKSKYTTKFRTFRGGDSDSAHSNTESKMRKMSNMKSENMYVNGIDAQKTSHHYHNHTHRNDRTQNSKRHLNPHVFDAATRLSALKKIVRDVENVRHEK